VPSSTRPRVLCVDDDEDSRVMLVTLLKLAFIEAKAVGTAAQALSLIQAEHFDLYMLDGWLPEIDGFELCRRMRAFDPHTPILFFSGAAYEADKKKGIEAGADAYVIKPDIHGLVESIKQFTPHVAERPVAREIRPLAKTLSVSGKRLHLKSVENSTSMRSEFTQRFGFQLSCQPKESAKHPDATA
jgi:DNA-binding response OmpR family regulator